MVVAVWPTTGHGGRRTAIDRQGGARCTGSRSGVPAAAISVWSPRKRMSERFSLRVLPCAAFSLKAVSRCFRWSVPAVFSMARLLRRGARAPAEPAHRCCAAVSSGRWSSPVRATPCRRRGSLAGSYQPPRIATLRCSRYRRSRLRLPHPQRQDLPHRCRRPSSPPADSAAAFGERIRPELGEEQKQQRSRSNHHSHVCLI